MKVMAWFTDSEGGRGRKLVLPFGLNVKEKANMLDHVPDTNTV